jgi:hypothetical protein
MRTKIAAVGVVYIVPEMLKQAIQCSLLSSVLLVLNVTQGHYTVAA